MIRNVVTIINGPQEPGTVSMKKRQVPLCQHYVSKPKDAIVIDSARTTSDNVDANNPLESAVTFCKKSPIQIAVGVHTAVGGKCDNPTPGDILCGAIASCLDSTIRIISNRLGIKLKRIDVEVHGTVDVRGTLRVDRTTPVAFQSFDVKVVIKPARWLPEKMLDKILSAAEYSCIVIQTVKKGANVTVQRVD